MGKRRVNLKFLGLLLGSVVVFGGGIHFLHGYQVRRNANVFLDHAAKAEAEQDVDKAIQHLSRYLSLMPHDAPALAKYGELLAFDPEGSKNPKVLLRAFFALERSLLHDATQADVRKRIIELAMDRRLGRETDAVDHLKVLMESLGTTSETLTLRARCNVVLLNMKDARRDFEEALKLKPGRLDAYQGLADLLRRHDSKVVLKEKELKEVHEQAEKIIAEMLKEHGQSFKAHLWCADHYRAFANKIHHVEDAAALAAEHVETAAKLAPDDVAVIFAVAEMAKQHGKIDEARASLERGIGLYPKKWQFYQALSSLEHANNQPEAALAALQRGIKEVPQQANLEWGQALLLVDLGRSSEASNAIDRLRKMGVGQTELEYLQAGIYHAEKEWGRAIQSFERIHPLLLGRADKHRDWLAINLLYNTEMKLGQCYHELGDVDAAASSFTRAVSRAPNSTPARLALARCERALGKYDHAIREYRTMMQAKYAPADAWIECAELLIVRNLNQNQPNWSEVERVLTQAEQLKPVPVQVGLLRAEMMAARKEVDKALNFLLKGHDDPAQRPLEVWIGMAGLEDRRGQGDAALRLLDEAAKTYGDRPELLEARCRLWARRAGPEAPRALDQIALSMENFKDNEQRRLLPILARSYVQLGQHERAIHVWKVAANKGVNVMAQMALFDLALEKGDFDEAQLRVENLREIEAASGTLWKFCQACLLLAQNDKQRNAGQLQEAHDLLTTVAKRRPTWVRVPIAQAQLSELNGDLDRALGYYQRAWAFGVTNPVLIERHARLLSYRGRGDEAAELLQQARNRGVNLTYLGRLEADIALRRADYDQALRLAEEAVTQNSKDYRDFIWLGQIKFAAGKKAEAEAEFRRATTLAPDVPATWITLVGHFVRIDQKDKAKQTVSEAAKAINKDRAAVALAQCHMLLDELDEAKKLFQSALAVNPDDQEAIMGMTLHSLRTGQSTEAITYLERLVALKNLSASDLAAANRTLALVVAAGGGYQEQLKAIKMLGVHDPNADDQRPGFDQNVADKRAKIAILAQAQNLRQRREAVSLLEDLLRQHQISNDERFVLAQLYDAIGQWSKSQEQYLFALNASRDAIDRDPRNKTIRAKRYADQVAAYCAALLRHDAVSRIEPWLATLEAMEPRSLRVVSLRAQTLHKQKRGAEAVPELLALEKTDERLVGPIAAVLEQIGEKEMAEKMYKKHAATSKLPEAGLALAAFYGRQNRIDEALNLCEAALKKCKIEQVASVCVLVLYTGKPSGPQCHRVAVWLETAIAKQATSELLEHLAAVRRLQGDYAGMIDIYRQASQTDPNNALVLNNLAWLRALNDRDGPGALAAIQRAIELDGPQANYLDTRGVVYLVNNDPQSALKDLTEAIAEQPTAHRYFHLAQAHQLAGNSRAAREALQRGVNLGLAETTVDPLERSALRELQAQLDVKLAPR